MSAPLAVSMGDPAGIGLELAARVWSEGGAPAFYVIGDSNALQRAARRIGIDTLRPRLAATVADLDPEFGGPQILHAALAIDETPGEPDPVNAEPIIGAIRGAVSCVREGAASALVTLPIAKASLYTAGFGFPGHTEFIADLVKDAPFPERTRGPVMMLAGADLRVALATIHLPLARVAEHLSVESLARVARVVCEALRFDFGIDAPRLALCGLNPHAGEGGALGREEIDIINPAAARLRNEAGTFVGVSASRGRSSQGAPTSRTRSCGERGGTQRGAASGRRNVAKVSGHGTSGRGRPGGPERGRGRGSRPPGTPS
jgi:4-hydroxythreonine-4-phosphate dehydrogenase